MSAVKKKVRPGKVELSADAGALDVHYESLEVATLPSGDEVVQASKAGVKSIKFVLPHGGSADLRQLAQQLVDGSKLLHASRLPEVEQLLVRAKEQQDQQAAAASAAPAAAAGPQQAPLETPHRYSEQDRRLLHGQQQQYLAAAASTTQALSAAAATASLEHLEEYLEALYEEDPSVKTAAVAAMAHLCHDPRSLGALLAHPTLLQVLARLLREDARRSSELCTGLLMVFFALSHLPQAHPLLTQNQVGSLTMELLDLELRRAEHWHQQEGVAVADVGAKLLAAAAGDNEPLAAAEQRLAVALARHEPALYLGLSLLLNMAEDAEVEQKMVKKGLLSLLVVVLDRGSPQLLVLAATFLRKLSLYGEHCRALRQSGVVGQLAALVPSDGGPLLTAALRLLHNLSFDEGMRAQMVASGLIAKAAALLKAELPGADACGGSSSSNGGGTPAGWAASKPRPSTALAWQQQQPLPPLPGASSAEGPELRRRVLGLLYHLSLEDRHRSMFLYTDAASSLHTLLMAAPLPLATSSPELVALLVSLAGSKRVAEEISRGGRLEQLLELALGPAEPAAGGQAAAEGALEGMLHSAAQRPGGLTSAAGGPGAADLMLWKLLRAMAEHDSEPLRARFAPALERLARLLMGGSLPADSFAEALGCLACLDIPGHDYAQLLHSTQLHIFLAGLAAAGGNRAEQENMVLEAVLAVGVLCADEACAAMLASAGLVEVLHALILEHTDDEDLVLATTTTAARMLAQPATQAALLAHAELAARFAELLQHPLKRVAHAADAALDAVTAGSEEWAASVRRLKFEAHNREWLQVIQSMHQDGDAPAAVVGGEQLNAATWGESDMGAAALAAGAT